MTQQIPVSDRQAHQALDIHGQDFIKYVPVDELLFSLESEQIISSRQKAEIKNILVKSDKADKLFEILRNERGGRDFMTFCQLLQEVRITTVQEFGARLLTEARSSGG